MKFRRILTVVLGVAIVATLVIVFINLKGKSKSLIKIESLADGEGLVVYSYNKKNEKVMELKCKESKMEPNGRTILKKIEGKVYQRGQRKKDILIYGDQGYVESNTNNFFVEKNARIISEDFSVTSDHFLLKDQAELISAPKVVYKTIGLEGSTQSGMTYFLNMNIVRFDDTEGVYRRDNRTFTYKAYKLWFMEKEQLLTFEKDAVIREAKSYLRSDWVSMKFTPDMKHLIESMAQKSSYLFIYDRENKESKEIKGEVINSKYDSEGHLVQMLAMQNVQILLDDTKNQTMITSQLVEMNYDGPTGKPKNLVLPGRGTIENTGKTIFKITADSVNLVYNNKGAMKTCEGKGNVDFIIEKYNGVTGKLNFDIEKNFIAANGDKTELLNSQNIFRSVYFGVDSKNNILSTSAGIKSIIRMEGGNVLFNSDPIYISSKKFTTYEKESKSIYEKEISLVQGTTLLKANNLQIGKDNTINASGGVSLTFTDRQNGKNIAIKGDKMVFNPKEKRIEIKGTDENLSVIRSEETVLRALDMAILFNEKNELMRITGEKKVYFNKGDISGHSNVVNWIYTEESMVFTGSPYIARKSKVSDSGKTTGKILKIDLKTDKITIISDDSSRTETVIQD